MADDRNPELGESAAMSADELYREEVFTDQRVGTIRQLIPVKANGTADDSRPVQFQGQAQILTPAGALPINFQIEAANLAEAVQKFGDEAGKAVEQTMKDLQDMRREAASSIVIPESGNIPTPPAGGGKIQLR